VIVGDGVSIRGDEKAGPDAGNDLMVMQLTVREVELKEPFERRSFQGWGQVFVIRPGPRSLLA